MTADHGVLSLSIIPAQNQPDWLVPSEMILSIEEYQDYIWTYLWDNGRHHQEVAVYHLYGRGEPTDKLVILEGNTDVHRLALQTRGQIQSINVRISDVKDVALADNVLDAMQKYVPPLSQESHHLTDYMFEAVSIGGVAYLVPDLDAIAHRLVDLDS